MKCRSAWEQGESTPCGIWRLQFMHSLWNLEAAVHAGRFEGFGRKAFRREISRRRGSMEAAIGREPYNSESWPPPNKVAGRLCTFFSWWHQTSNNFLIKDKESNIL